MRRYGLLVIISVLMLSVGLSTQAQDGNLLQNPGFESETYTFVSADPLAQAVTYSVPGGWGGAVITAPRSASWMNIHPTGFPHFTPFVLAGNRSFHISRGSATFTAFIYQQVSVTPDTPVEGGAWAFIENGSGTAIARVGIDPNGGTNPFAPTVIWSDPAANGFNWNRMSVASTAQGGVVTLFLFATQSFPVDPNGVYWDEAFLYGNPGTSAPAPSQPGGQVVTTDVRLNVRSGPGTGFNRIGRMNPGEAYSFISDNNGWFALDFNGQTGYVSAQYASVSGGQPTAGQNPAPAPSQQVVQSSVRLNVRSGPGTSFDRIGVLTPSDSYALIGEENGWFAIAYNGNTGYVSGQFASVSGGQPTAGSESPPAPSGDFTPTSFVYTVSYNVRMRSGPASSFDELTTIPVGTALQVGGRTGDGNWFQVSYNGQTGWVASWLGRFSGSINDIPVIR